MPCVNLTKHNIKILIAYTFRDTIAHLIERYYEWYLANKGGLITTENLKWNIDFLESHYHRYLSKRPEYDFELYAPCFRRQMNFLLDIDKLVGGEDRIREAQRLLREKKDKRNEELRRKKILNGN